MNLDIRSRLTTYDLFAITVAVMVFGHAAGFFWHDQIWLRGFDRALAPVFLVAAGYNVGRKSGAAIWIAMLTVVFCFAYFTKTYLPLNFLATLILLRFVIDPVYDFMLKSRLHFWGVNFVCAMLALPSDRVLEYGSVALMMAVAGRLRRDEHHVSKALVDARLYFIFVGAVYLALVFHIFKFSYLEGALVAAGAGFAMWLLYDFRRLILNALKHRPKTVFERVRHFVGHKSLEIYAAHLLLFFLIASFVP